jgi:hypothetical protein
MASLLALAVLSGGVAAAATHLRAHPDLQPITVERLLANVIRAATHGPDVSGTVSATVDLGLPSFPDRGPAPTGLAGLLAELSGTHRIRVWSSADGYRVNELLPTEERAIYVGRGGGWLWSSPEYTAVHLYDAEDLAKVRDAAASASQAEHARLLHLFDPLALARQALAAVSSTTRVTMGSPERVAGRAAYLLVLAPKDATTLVGRVTVAVDAATHVPLAVRVYAKGASSPALSAAFVRVLYDPIPASVYMFTPPPGARVIDAYREGSEGSAPTGGGGSMAGIEGVRVLGSGWSTILAVRVPADALARAGSGDGARLEQLLPFSGPLFSVRLATVGGQTWLLAGAIPQRELAAAELDLR